MAFPNTLFQIVKEINDTIVQVSTPSYKQDPLFTDRRFLKISHEAICQEPRLIQGPNELLTGELLKKLEQLKGTPYVWGGNYHKGIPELLEFYPPSRELTAHERTNWTLAGVDCSGLLYQVTEGLTPRNTSELVHFGRAVEIQDLTLEKIMQIVSPLDLIVWLGHVVIVYDGDRTIESRVGKGVVFTNLKERLQEIIETEKKRPVNHWDPSIKDKSRFVIRRWHGIFA